jgi:hypothetical protein
MAVAESGVRVALPSIHRQLRRNGHDGVHLLWRPSGAAESCQALAAATAAVRHANAAVPPETVRGEDATPFPKGVLDRVGTRQQTEAWLAAFAGHLERAGWSGSVGPAPVTWYPDWLQQYGPVVTAYVGHRLLQPYLRGGGALRWDVDDRVTASLCRHAVAWGWFSPSEVYVMVGSASLRMAEPDVSGLLLGALRRGSLGDVHYARREPFAARRVGFSPFGQAVYSVRDAQLPWREHVEAVRDALVAHAASVELGFVRYSRSSSPDWVDLAHLEPPTPSGIHFTVERQLWGEYVPDAHGLQLLTERHLARVNDLGGWRVDEIAPGRFLVQARDLAAWYAEPIPDPAVLDRARRDFGDAVMSRELASALQDEYRASLLRSRTSSPTE